MPTPQERNRMITKDFKANLAPCIITFSIPLLIPGITLTLVAFGNEPAIPLYGSLHILGFFILILAILMFIIGCVLRCAFKTARVSPIEEIHRVVTTHDKLDKNMNNSTRNNKSIKVVTNGSQRDLRDIYQNNHNYHHHHHPNEPSTSSSVPNNSYNRNSSLYDSSSSASLMTRSNSNSSLQSNKQLNHSDFGNKEVTSDPRDHCINNNTNNNNSETRPDPYPLGRLPSLDLKHTKYSYSSQDKPDEEMSIIDETNRTSPDHLQQSNKTHLGDLPDINQERQRALLSYDNTSYTSTESISGHIIRTNKEEYLRRDSELFSY